MKLFRNMVCLMLSLAMLVPVAGIAEGTATLTQQTLQTSEFTAFSYWLYTPDGATSGMPLVVYMEDEPKGMGRGNAKWVQENNAVDESLLALLQGGTLTNVPAYILIPELPESAQSWTAVQPSVYELIQSVMSLCQIDAAKVSLVGSGSGGSAALALANAYPDAFSCLAPLGVNGIGYGKNTSYSFTIPVWAITGSKDNTAQRLLSSIQALQQNGVDAKMSLIEEAKQSDVPKLVFVDKSLDLMNWLLSNSRTAPVTAPVDSTLPTLPESSFKPANMPKMGEGGNKFQRPQPTNGAQEATPNP